MLINILIRTSFRPNLFKICIESIYTQTYKNINIIVSYDDDRALEYIPEEFQKVRVCKSDAPFFYDNYCNDLKELVTDGWFFFMDDDDILYDHMALEKISKYLNGIGGVVCQFNRNGKLKPSNELIRTKRIQRSKIGMPCLFLHHSLKNVAYFDGSVGASDYLFIKDVALKVKLKFVPIAVVYAGSRGNGQME